MWLSGLLVTLQPANCYFSYIYFSFFSVKALFKVCQCYINKVYYYYYYYYNKNSSIHWSIFALEMYKKVAVKMVSKTWCCPLAHQQVSLAHSPPLKDEEGHSVGRLLTSCDRTLVVKEISSEEVEEMHNILSEYHQVGGAQIGKMTSGICISCLNNHKKHLGYRSHSPTQHFITHTSKAISSNSEFSVSQGHFDMWT